jgi:hypothetical protein
VENWWMTLWKTAAESCGLRVVSQFENYCAQGRQNPKIIENATAAIASAIRLQAAAPKRDEKDFGSGTGADPFVLMPINADRPAW